MAHVTVYDVADRAGVSISTVSRVLNAPEMVNASTRSRVRAAIDELGFVPKAEAAARARKSQGRIGVLAPFFTYSSFVQRLGGVAAALADSSYELTIYTVDTSARKEAYLCSLPVTHRVDGLILIALSVEESIVERLRHYELPAVLVEFSDPNFSSIEIDNQLGGRMAGEYLIAKGHRRCAFIGDSNMPDYALPNSNQRLAGFREALESAGIALEPEQIALAPQSQENARELAHRLLNLPEPPTAIFAASDTQAMGVLKAARERGLSVPGQLAVIGFDDLEVADLIGLTTIRQPLEASGRVAVDLLLTHLADPSRPPQRIHLPLSLVPRETA